MERKPFPLFVALESDKGEKITQLSARLFTIGEYEDVSVKFDSPEDQTDELCKLMTGLSEKEFESLSAPDYTSLVDYVVAQQEKDLSFFGGEKPSGDSIKILQEILTDDGAQLSVFDLKVPSVKAVRMRDKQGGTSLFRAFWMVSYCTGVGVDDLKKLSMPDWMAIQGRLGSFLSKPAAFFLSGTSNT